MIDRSSYNPVRPFSWKGKVLVGLIRFVFGVRRLFGGKDFTFPVSDHHEDPLFMRFRDLLYFSHKYYYRAVTKWEPDREKEDLFKSSDSVPEIPQDFVPETQITLSAGGDLMPYAAISSETCSSLWEEAGDFFFEADIVTANLETPVNSSKKASLVPEVMLNHMYFNGDEDMFRVFSGNNKYKGYDVLSVANNHSFDQGKGGLISTMQFLKEKGVAYCGAALSESTVNDFPILERAGIRIAFLSATFSLNAESLPEGENWWVNHLPLNREHPAIDTLVTQARTARERGADLIVAHLHMGCAYQPYPSGHTVDNMHLICKHTGIDLILGGHPHNPQPAEIYSYTDPFSGSRKSSVITYSMGDFVAYDIFKWCHLPLLYKFTISKGSSGTFITSVQARFYYTEAVFKKGKVDQLKLRDLNSLRKHRNFMSQASAREFDELLEFHDTYFSDGPISEWSEYQEVKAEIRQIR